MRRPRRRQPDQFLEITIRCHHGRFRFLPTKERNDVIGFWLAKAQKKCPGIQLLCVGAMSNHIHFVIYDRDGELSRFFQYALGFIAKGINRIDDVRGALFERRFAEIVVLDHDALARRIAYAACNPVEANLVRDYRDWTGLCFVAGAEAAIHSFTILHEGRYRRALQDAERTGATVNRDDFLETAELEIAPLEEAFAAQVATAVEERQSHLQAQQTGVLGIQKVLQQSPFDHPKMFIRTKMPLCFASSSQTSRAFANTWYTFVDAFREASEKFRNGVLTVAFPMFSFRPCIPAT
jgi:REP element-mobilizing transposase RayT